MDDEDLPRRQTEAVVALTQESLDDLSVFELRERIEVLQGEIARTEAAINAKEAGQSEADKYFS